MILSLEFLLLLLFLSLSHIQLFSTPWTVAHQALLSIEFPRQEYWSGLSFPFPLDFLAGDINKLEEFRFVMVKCTHQSG